MRKKLIIIMVCIAGVLLNFAISRLNTFAGLPFYLDTILTISITLVLGPVWGAICGTLTNIMGHTIWFWGWAGYLFILCQIATAYITGAFMHFFPKEMYPGIIRTALKASHNKSRSIILRDKIIILFLLALVLSIAISIIGGTISTFIIILYPAFDREPGLSTLTVNMFSNSIPIFIREILSRVPINIVDRLISVFAAYGIAVGLRILLHKIMPNK